MRFLKHLSTTIIIPILFLPLLAGFAHADGFLIDFSPVTNAVNGVTGAVNGVTSGVAGIATQITDLPSSLWHFFTDSIKQSLTNFVQSLLDIEKALVTKNPDTLAYTELWSLVVGIISAFYLLVLFYVGFQFLLATDEGKRLKAKESAEKAIKMIIIVNASLLLYGTFLSLSSAISTALWDASLNSYFTSINISLGNILLILVLIVGVLLSLVTLFIRYLLLITGFALVPIGVFLYFSDIGKTWGQFCLNLVGAGVVMQIFDSVIFSASMAVVHDLAGMAGIELLGPAMGFLFITIVNVLIMLFAVNKIQESIIPLNVLSSRFVSMGAH